MILSLLWGCDARSGPTGDAPTPDPDTIPTALAPCGAADPPAGVVDVAVLADLFHGAPYGEVSARVLEAPDPSFHRVTLEDGACRLFEFANGACDPPCVGGELCTADDTCAAFPASVSGGVVSVFGLATPIELEASDFAPGLYDGPAGLAADLFAAGDPIGARLSGGEVGPLALGATGVAQLDTDLVESGLEILDGADASVGWTPGPDPDACVGLVLNGSNALHGAPLQAFVVCEGTDTGTLVVPRAVVEAFPHGASPLVTEGYDWPHSSLTRYTRSRADGAFGPVELLVRSSVSFLLSHP